MKDDALYPYYFYYLNSRLLDGKISRGSYSLLLISGNYFDDFKVKFENDKQFAKLYIRDKKINDINEKNR